MRRTLFAVANERKYFEPIPGAGHNDLSLGKADPYWSAVQAFFI